MTIVAGVPLKGFDAAKTRVALPAASRAALARATADRVVSAIAEAGFEPLVVAGSADVAAWAQETGVGHLDEPDGGGLDAAASLVAASAPLWCVIHGDLPLLTAADLEPVADALNSGAAVIAPSRDGGTNLIGGSGTASFSYGPGSFARHLTILATLSPQVVVNPGLAIEIDTLADLRAAAQLPGGAWLAAYLA